MGFKKVGYLSFFMVIILLIIIIFAIFNAKTLPTEDKVDFCKTINPFDDNNYLIPYSLFLLNYLGLDLNENKDILKDLTLKINAYSSLEDINSSSFDLDAIKALLQNKTPEGQICFYDISLISTKDLLILTPKKANEPLIKMYWLVNSSLKGTKILDSLILETLN